jgi:hypothetical protein
MVRAEARFADGGERHVILVLDQYKCIVCSLGKHRDSRTRATDSDDDSRGSVYDKCLRIAA